MSRFSEIAAIAPDLGRIFLFMGVVSCLPLLVGLMYAEYEILLAMASAPAVFVLPA